MYAQVFFRSLAESTVLVDLVVLEDEAGALEHIGTAGQPVTVALCLEDGSVVDIEHADRQFEEWANAMSIVEITVVEADETSFLHLEGPGDDLTLELSSGFRWSRDAD